MKKLLLASLVTLSMSAFSQSYLVIDNGTVITTDKTGFAYDLGHFSAPEKILLKGGQFFAEEGGVLATIDDAGVLHRKYEVLPEVIKGKGTNYFISGDGALYTIDHQGVVTITEDEAFKNAVSFGGSYFIVQPDAEKKVFEIYAVKADGKFMKVALDYLKATDIVANGGNYFMSNRGVVFTVSAEGAVVPRADVRVEVLVKKGGNFFTDSSGMIFTVAEDGTLKMPALPMNLKISAILKVGSNYFIDNTGRFFVVDKTGNIWERVMRDHDFRTVNVISI